MPKTTSKKTAKASKPTAKTTKAKPSKPTAKPATWSDSRRARDVAEATITACRPPQNDRLTKTETWAIGRYQAGLDIREIIKGSGIAVRRLVALLELDHDLTEAEIAALETFQRTLALGKGVLDDERFAGGF